MGPDHHMANGATAQKVARRLQHIELCALDIHLHEMDGRDRLQHRRQRPHFHANRRPVRAAARQHAAIALIDEACLAGVRTHGGTDDFDIPAGKPVQLAVHLEGVGMAR